MVKNIRIRTRAVNRAQRFDQHAALRTGVIAGSLVSGFCGWLVLYLNLRKQAG